MKRVIIILSGVCVVIIALVWLINKYSISILNGYTDKFYRDNTLYKSTFNIEYSEYATAISEQNKSYMVLFDPISKTIQDFYFDEIYCTDFEEKFIIQMGTEFQKTSFSLGASLIPRFPHRKIKKGNHLRWNITDEKIQDTDVLELLLSMNNFLLHETSFPITSIVFSIENKSNKYFVRLKEKQELSIEGIKEKMNVDAKNRE